MDLDYDDDDRWPSSVIIINTVGYLKWNWIHSDKKIYPVDDHHDHHHSHAHSTPKREREKRWIWNESVSNNNETNNDFKVEWDFSIFWFENFEKNLNRSFFPNDFFFEFSFLRYSIWFDLKPEERRKEKNSNYLDDDDG